jgi:hypothetical protein
MEVAMSMVRRVRIAVSGLVTVGIASLVAVATPAYAGDFDRYWIACTGILGMGTCMESTCTGPHGLDCTTKSYWYLGSFWGEL